MVGHRGASGLAPENTIAAFDLAISQGAEAFEFDVRLTSDGIPAVFHDPVLDRTTDRTGPIGQLHSRDLAGVDAGAGFRNVDGETPFRGIGVGIPTLRDILVRYPTTPLLIELKTVDVGPAVREELLRAHAADRALVASFLHDALAPFREPPFHRGASRRDISVLVGRSLLGASPPADAPAAYAVPARYKELVTVPTRRFVAAAARRGIPVHVWTVNDTATAEELWDRGCAGMISNFPGAILEARRRRFGS